jgi:hypothetical protein
MLESRQSTRLVEAVVKAAPLCGNNIIAFGEAGFSGLILTAPSSILVKSFWQERDRLYSFLPIKAFM